MVWIFDYLTSWLDQYSEWAEREDCGSESIHEVHRTVRSAWDSRGRCHCIRVMRWCRPVPPYADRRRPTPVQRPTGGPGRLQFMTVIDPAAGPLCRPRAAGTAGASGLTVCTIGSTVSVPYHLYHWVHCVSPVPSVPLGPLCQFRTFCTTGPTVSAPYRLYHWAHCVSPVPSVPLGPLCQSRTICTTWAAVSVTYGYYCHCTKLAVVLP